MSTKVEQQSLEAAVLKCNDGYILRFPGKYRPNEGDVVALGGRSKHDPKYRRQFLVDSLSYELFESAEGLDQYVAKHPAFTGIGEVTDRKIVGCATSATLLDRILRQDIDEQHRPLRLRRRS